MSFPPFSLTPSPCPPSPSFRHRRADKGGVVHAGLGKVSFPLEQLQANIAAFAAAILAARPKGVKGAAASGYILSATLSSTMGPGIPLALPGLVSAAQAASKAK